MIYIINLDQESNSYSIFENSTLSAEGSELDPLPNNDLFHERSNINIINIREINNNSFGQQEGKYKK